MKLEHAALWTPDLERARTFYAHYFGGQAGPRYANPNHGFASYFLLRSDGYPVIREAYRTGDGYYESTVLDPDGNRIEIAALPA